MRLNRSLPALAAVVSFVFLGFVFHLSPTPESGFNTLRNLIQTTTDSQNTIIEVEGLTLGARFIKADGVKPILFHGFETPSNCDSLRHEDNQTPTLRILATVRFDQRDMQRPRWPEQGHFGWYKKERRPIVSFAITLRDSESILPAQSLALVEAVAFLL